MFQDLFKIIGKSSDRSKGIVKNIGISLIMKSSNIICSLLIIPLTINYINPERYGIWLTISSIIGWIVFFDLGLGNGFRNRFVKARACSNDKLCKEYVSTAYITIGAIVSVVWIITFIVNYYIDWSGLLNVSPSLNTELRKVFGIVTLFTCMNMVVNLFSTLLTADLRPGLASLITGIGQWGILAAIYILKLTTRGSLINLAIVYSSIPCLTMTIVSILMFNFSRYRLFKPSIKLFRHSLLKDILGLGSKFFIICLCLIVIFQMINLIISREIGSIGVTQYTIANKYFSIIYMVVNIVMVPIWSAVTDAYERNDFTWLHSLNKNLKKFTLISIIGFVFLLLISPFVYKIWIGNSVHISFYLSCSMCIFFICQTINSVYINQINGFGKLQLQTIIYLMFALISWPLFTISARYFGLIGIVMVPTLVCLTQGILANIQVNKILNKNASGIWAK